MTNENVGARLFDVVQITPGGDWFFIDPSLEGEDDEKLCPVMVFALVESKVDGDDEPYKDIVPLGVDEADIGGLIGIEMRYFRDRELVHKSELGTRKRSEKLGFADTETQKAPHHRGPFAFSARRNVNRRPSCWQRVLHSSRKHATSMGHLASRYSRPW